MGVMQYSGAGLPHSLVYVTPHSWDLLGDPGPMMDAVKDHLDQGSYALGQAERDQSTTNGAGASSMRESKDGVNANFNLNKKTRRGRKRTTANKKSESNVNRPSRSSYPTEGSIEGIIGEQPVEVMNHTTANTSSHDTSLKSENVSLHSSNTSSSSPSNFSRDTFASTTPSSVALESHSDDLSHLGLSPVGGLHEAVLTSLRFPYRKGSARVVLIVDCSGQDINTVR